MPDFVVTDAVGKVLEMRRDKPQVCYIIRFFVIISYSTFLPISLFIQRNPPDLMQFMIDAEAQDHHGPLEIATDDDDEAKKAAEESVEIELSETEKKQHSGELAKRKLTTDVR